MNSKFIRYIYTNYAASKYKIHYKCFFCEITSVYYIYRQYDQGYIFDDTRKLDDVRKPKIFHHRYHADYTLMFNVITISQCIDKRYFYSGIFHQNKKQFLP